LCVVGSEGVCCCCERLVCLQSPSIALALIESLKAVRPSVDP
jgi:hypothetical protein